MVNPVGALQLADELRSYKLSFELELYNQSFKLILRLLNRQRISEMKTLAIIVDKTIYFVTIIALQQLIAPQQCRESTGSNENYIK